MRTVSMILCLLLCCCTTVRPYIHGVDPGDTDLAFQLIVKRLPEVYPNIPQAGALAYLRSVDLTYSAEDRFDIDGAPVAGMTYLPRLVWIKSTDRYNDASKNALIHESVHILLWRYYGDPDSNHEGPGGMWSKATSSWVVSIMQEIAQQKTTSVR